MSDTAGIRPLLFGIAVILVCGFLLIHDILRYGRGYGANTDLVLIGLGVGLFICLFGFLLGASTNDSTDTE